MLREHNRNTIPDEHRFKNLETLRSTLRDIFDQLKAHTSERTSPMTEQAQLIANLNHSLLREITTAYKIIARNRANDEATDSMSCTAICRAIRYQSEQLLRASETHAQSPAGTWADLHSLYDYAERTGIDELAVADQENTAQQATIKDYYKQTLLFSLARPGALPPQDIEQLYAKLADWARLAELSGDTDSDAINRHFCVSPEEDSPPHYLRQEDCDSDSVARTLDTSKLEEMIQERMAQPESSPLQLSDETLKILSSSWGTRDKRRFVRSTGIGYIETAIGIDAAIAAIEKENAIKRSSDPLYDKNQQAAREALNASIQALGNDNALDIQGLDIPFDDPITLAKEGDLQTLSETGDACWEIVNISAGGYCLRWNSDEASDAQIGELIAVREKASNGTFQWRVGAIRWMQYTREHGLEIGVQLLAPNVCTASLKKIADADDSSKSCLVLPGISHINLPATILLTDGYCDIGDRLALGTLAEELEIQLCSTGEKTNLFTQFVFWQTDISIEQHELENWLSHEETDDFKDIWTSL